MRKALIVLLCLLFPALAVAQVPVVDAGPDQTMYLGDSLALHGTATGDPILWQWEVISAPTGSSHTLAYSDTANPLFSTDTRGNYVITLTAWNYYGWSAPDAVVVTVIQNQPPAAEAIATPLSGPAPLLVSFDGTQSSDPEEGPLLYDWDFGDGTFGSGATRSHSYALPDVYQAVLTVIDERGLPDIDTVNITVCGDGINCPPVADAGEDENMVVNATTTLQGSAIDPDGDPIVAWLWSVDSAPEGSSPAVEWPNEPDPEFIPNAVGDYVLSLIATDGIDWSQPDFVTIHVRALLAPEAVIDVDVTTGYAPLVVHFDGSASTVDPIAGDLTYTWSFGDGSFSSGIASSHSYEVPSIYLATLTVVDELGQSDQDFVEITVEEPPPAWGEASVVEVGAASPSKGLNCLIVLLIPVGAVILWKELRKR